MSIKKVMKQLEKQMELNFGIYQAKFYNNRKNCYIHLGLDNSLFSFENYKEFLEEINRFLDQKLVREFKVVYPPKLVISTKWKQDYISRAKET